MTTRTSASEKRHVTVALTVAADGFILLPTIISRGKTNRTIKDIAAPNGFVIVTQKKAWMDEPLMLIWFDQVWKSYAEKKKTKGVFQQVVNDYDAFKAHTTDVMKVVL